MTHNSSKISLEKISLPLFVNFRCPKEWQNLKTRKFIILAQFSVINSLNEIWSPKPDTKIFQQDNPKTLLYQLVIKRKCRVWNFIVKFISLSPKMGQKWQFLRVLSVLSLFEAVRNHFKEEFRHFPMHIYNCSVIATCGIFSFSHIFRFNRAKNDHSWTLSFPHYKRQFAEVLVYSTGHY